MVRGSWLVASGSWFVASGSWLVGAARRLQSAKPPLIGEEAQWAGEVEFPDSKATSQSAALTALLAGKPGRPLQL